MDRTLKVVFCIVVLLFLYPITFVYYCRLLAWLQEKTLVVIECGVIAVRLAWRKFISWKLTPYTILSDYLIFWHVLTFLGTVTESPIYTLSSS